MSTLQEQYESLHSEWKFTREECNKVSDPLWIRMAELKVEMEKIRSISLLKKLSVSNVVIRSLEGDSYFEDEAIDDSNHEIIVYLGEAEYSEVDFSYPDSITVRETYSITPKGLLYLGANS